MTSSSAREVSCSVVRTSAAELPAPRSNRPIVTALAASALGPGGRHPPNGQRSTLTHFQDGRLDILPAVNGQDSNCYGLGGRCMLRFMLHRPSQDSAISACCHDLSCRDICGRVHVGVRPVPASHAHESRLALATRRCDVLAGVCDLYAAFTFSTLPGAFCSSRATSRPQPDLRMPRLSPGRPSAGIFCPAEPRFPRIVISRPTKPAAAGKLQD